VVASVERALFLVAVLAVDDLFWPFYSGGKRNNENKHQLVKWQFQGSNSNKFDNK